MRHLLILCLLGCSTTPYIAADGGPLGGDAGPSLGDAMVDAGLEDATDVGPALVDARDAAPPSDPDANDGPYLVDRFELAEGEVRDFETAGRPPARDATGMPLVVAPLGTGPGCLTDSDASYPVNCVSWAYATSFCAFRGQRLPTRAEWLLEAERSGPSFGDVVGVAAPDHTIRGGVGSCTTPLCDTRGNVSEWVADEASGGHVVMGGDFDDSSANLAESSSTGPDVHIGFRCRSL